MKKQLTETEKTSVIEYLINTCADVEEAIEQLGIEHTDFLEVESIISDTITPCAFCGWWVSLDELEDCYDDCHTGYCFSCLEDVHSDHA